MQSKAPCFLRLPKDGKNDLRGGDWASPQDLNLRDKTLPFRKKKKPHNRRKHSEFLREGWGGQNPKDPSALSSCTSTSDTEKRPEPLRSVVAGSVPGPARPLGDALECAGVLGADAAVMLSP